MSFDCRRFSYAHLTKCVDTIIGRSAGILHIKETCHAIGDGTPRTPYTQTFKLRLDDTEHFTLIGTKYSTPFRRCGDLTYFDKH